MLFEEPRGEDARTNIILVLLSQGRLLTANKWRSRELGPFERNLTPAMYTPRGIAHAMRHLARKDRTKKELRTPEYAIVPVGIATAATLVWNEDRPYVDDDLHTFPDAVIDASESAEEDRSSSSSSRYSFANTDDYHDYDYFDYYDP